MTMTQNDTTCWKTQENSSRYYLIFWCVINKINISNYVINSGKICDKSTFHLSFLESF